MIRLADQVAIITGSGRGLGAAYARLLSERGACVAVKGTTAEDVASRWREIALEVAF